MTFFFCAVFRAQNSKIDRLEQLYDQGHYGIVWRKANRFIEKNDFKSLLLDYYKSMAYIQRGIKQSFENNSFEEVEQHFSTLLSIIESPKNEALKNAHKEEVIQLVERLESFQTTQEKRSNQFKNLVQKYQSKLLGVVNSSQIQAKESKNQKQTDWKAPSDPAFVNQVRLIEFAFTLENVPYLYGGNTPEGFDCSGFISYVFWKVLQKKLPRRSVDQFTESVRIQKSDAQLGDLVFFGLKGEVSHVGILISEKGKPLRMIHASSSRGITTDWIEDSDYFRPRLMGFGRY